MLLLIVVVGLVLTCIFVKESEEGVSCVGKFLGRVGVVLLSAGGFLMLCVTLFPMFFVPPKNVSDEISCWVLCLISIDPKGIRDTISINKGGNTFGYNAIC